jgi:hypothetical protein
MVSRKLAGITEQFHSPAMSARAVHSRPEKRRPVQDTCQYGVVVPLEHSHDVRQKEPDTSNRSISILEEHDAGKSFGVFGDQRGGRLHVSAIEHMHEFERVDCRLP